ncbi:hypothetical protein KY344_04375 [Candidatus Woesearchaeota archaeon]|nr:hypothetical protein [Candidatus Woesearchaeota archaeon]
MVNGGSYFQSALMITRCDFCDYVFFRNRFVKFFEPLPYSKKAVLKKINSLIKDYKNNKGVVDNEKAQRILLSRDLEKIRDTLKNVNIPKPMDDLKTNYAKLKKICKKLGLTDNFPEYFIVDTFPKPYHKMNWLCAFFDKDEEEEEDDDITPGIYLRKDKIMQSFAITKNLCHELIHIIINQYTKKDNTISRGLEEGICDFVGSIYLFGLIEGFDKAKNINYHSKFSYYKTQELLDLYREALVQACLLYKNIGIKGMINLIKKGRNHIREAEKLCLQGKYNKIKIKKGGWTPELDRIADYFISVQHSLRISPMAYHVAGLLKKKMKVNDLIKQHSLDRKATLKALRELQKGFFLITVNKGKVCYDTTKNYLEVGAVKYANTS